MQSVVALKRALVMNAFLLPPEPIVRTPASWENSGFPDPAPPAWSHVEPPARILFVDDEPVLRSLGQLVLARSGYAVDTASDGAEAWAALHEQEYHLLITDNHMPCLTGLGLIQKIRRARMSLPIILASAMLSAYPDEALPWLEGGAVLAKPFTTEKLVSVVHEVLQAAASADYQMTRLEELNAQLQSHRSEGVNV